MSDVLSQTHPKRLEVHQIGHLTDTCRDCPEIGCPLKSAITKRAIALALQSNNIFDGHSDHGRGNAVKNPTGLYIFTGDTRHLNATITNNGENATVSAVCFDNKPCDLVGAGKWEEPLQPITN